jgi:hypothetical protein
MENTTDSGNLSQVDTPKDLFNSMNFSKIFLFVVPDNIFREMSDKGALRYRKINFFTASALSGLGYLAVR